MTYAVVALSLVIAALLVAKRLDARLLAAVLAEAAKERASLLDRIQHPQVRQVEPGEPVVHEPPKDTAEMAYVGQEVPEFVHVGSEKE